LITEFTLDKLGWLYVTSTRKLLTATVFLALVRRFVFIGRLTLIGRLIASLRPLRAILIALVTVSRLVGRITITALVTVLSRWLVTRLIAMLDRLITVTLLVTTLILAVWHINDFAIVWVMTQGGPSNATELIVINAYKVAFEAFRFGESSAIGVVLLVFSLLFGVLYLKATKAFE
jgi:hypothetical protein